MEVIQLSLQRGADLGLPNATDYGRNYGSVQLACRSTLICEPSMTNSSSSSRARGAGDSVQLDVESQWR